MKAENFYIASLKHTNKNHEHIVWWQKNHSGYTPVIGDYVGEYSADEARELNDGLDCIAVPVAVVQSLLSAEPYYKLEGRAYDQRGPVVDNTRALWNLLIASAKPSQRPKPRPFRGKRRLFGREHFQ
jgi:hypothetical protein